MNKTRGVVSVSVSSLYILYSYPIIIHYGRLERKAYDVMACHAWCAETAQQNVKCQVLMTIEYDITLFTIKHKLNIYIVYVFIYITMLKLNFSIINQNPSSRLLFSHLSLHRTVLTILSLNISSLALCKLYQSPPSQSNTKINLSLIQYKFGQRRRQKT
jgi:hypothetical protein